MKNRGVAALKRAGVLSLFLLAGAGSQAEIEKLAILHTLEQTRGNKRKAATLLGVYRPTLYSKLRKHGLLDQSSEPPGARTI